MGVIPLPGGSISTGPCRRLHGNRVRPCKAASALTTSPGGTSRHSSVWKSSRLKPGVSEVRILLSRPSRISSVEEQRCYIPSVGSSNLSSGTGFVVHRLGLRSDEAVNRVRFPAKLPWGISSFRQSTCFANRRWPVRDRHSPRSARSRGADINIGTTSP